MHTFMTQTRTKLRFLSFINTQSDLRHTSAYTSMYNVIIKAGCVGYKFYWKTYVNKHMFQMCRSFKSNHWAPVSHGHINSLSSITVSEKKKKKRLFMAPNLVRAQSAYKDIMIRPFHHTHIQTDTDTHTHTHTRTHARARARTHARTHSRTHAHAHTHYRYMVYWWWFGKTTDRQSRAGSQKNRQTVR